MEIAAFKVKSSNGLVEIKHTSRLPMKGSCYDDNERDYYGILKEANIYDLTLLASSINSPMSTL